MKERILQFIKDNPGSDALDISYGLNVFIISAIKYLQELVSEDKIRREFYGMSKKYYIK